MYLHEVIVQFEWDETKDRMNLRKHGIDFRTAARVFLDPNRVEDYDDRFSYGEDRWRVIGIVSPALIVVIYTERGDVTRLISARKADSHEEKLYHTLHP